MIEVTVNNPFAIRHLPCLLRLYQFAYSPYRNRFHRTLFRLPFRKLYRLLRGLGSSHKAILYLNTNRERYALQFAAANLQYHSVYLPQHRPIYEPEVSALLTLLAPTLDCFWDVGANWGHHTLSMLAHASFRGRIEAFEPNALVARELERHVLTIGHQQRARVHAFGLSSYNGRAQLELPDNIHSGLGHVRRQDSEGNALVEQGDILKLPSPDLIKIDVEGSEADVLLGCERILKQHKPVVIVEIWPGQVAQTEKVISLLETAGYIIFHPVFDKIAEGDRSSPDGLHFSFAQGFLTLRPAVEGLKLEKFNAVALPPSHRLRSHAELAACSE